MFEEFKRNSGGPTRSDWNRLLEKLETLTVTPGPGLLMRRTPSGTTLWPKKRVGRGGGSDSIAFQVYGVRLDGSDWKCKIRPGYVRTINPDSAATEPVKDWMPTDASDVPLDATPEDTPAGPPEFTFTSGQTLYCRVATTAKGIIEAAPTIEAGATPEAGVHFQPPNADVEGDLYLPIAKFEISGDPAVVTVTQIQQGGPIVVTPNLPELKNIGGEREIVKGRTDAGDTYDLRTLRNSTADGEKVILDAGEGGDPDAISLATIKQRDEDSGEGYPQVKVVTVGDDQDKAIEIQGNGVNLDLSGYRLTSLTVRDGLVTTGGGEGDAESSGWWGTITHEFDLAAAFGGGSPVTLVQTFEDGRLITVTKSTGYTSGTGTEADPGVVIFQTRDYP